MLLLPFLIPVHSEAVEAGTNKLETTGYLSNEIAYRYREQATLTKLLTIFQLKNIYLVNEDVHLTMIGRVYYDPVYDIIPLERLLIPKAKLETDIDSVSVKNRGIELKELYLSLFFDNLDLKLGKQIVRWGVLEGFGISDIINPLNFKEYIFREVEDRYIPLWMLKADYYWGETSTEFIWIPDLKFHEPAPKGTEFEEFRLPPGLRRPAVKLKNTEFAWQSHIPVKEATISAGYFYGWDDFPAAFRTIFGLGSNLSDVDFKPRYTRERIFFSTYTQGIGSVVLNAEAAYISGKFFGTSPTGGSETGHEEKKDFLKYGIGIGMTIKETDIVLQGVQDYIMDYSEEILQRRHENAGSLFLRKKFMYDRVTVQALVLYLATHSEALIRPRITYKLKEQVTISAGADIFNGDAGDLGIEDFQFIGFFDQHDRVYADIKYDF